MSYYGPSSGGGGGSSGGGGYNQYGSGGNDSWRHNSHNKYRDNDNHNYSHGYRNDARKRRRRDNDYQPHHYQRRQEGGFRHRDPSPPPQPVRTARVKDEEAEQEHQRSYGDTRHQKQRHCDGSNAPAEHQYHHHYGRQGDSVAKRESPPQPPVRSVLTKQEPKEEEERLQGQSGSNSNEIVKKEEEVGDEQGEPARVKNEDQQQQWWIAMGTDRQLIRNHLNRLQSWEARKLLFRELPLARQIEVYLTDDWQRASFPDLEFPADFQNRQDRALTSTLKWIDEELCNKNNRDNKHASHYDSDEYSSDSSNDMIHLMSKKSSFQLDCEALAKALPFCFPLHIGFHLHFLIRSIPNRDSCCFCPCGGAEHLKQWREDFELTHFLGTRRDPRRLCKSGPPTGPFQLLKHCQAVNDVCHRIIYKYLETCYQNYHQEYAFNNNGSIGRITNSFRHIAFEDIGSRAHKRTSKLLSQEIQKIVLMLQQKAERANRLAAELERAKAAQEQVEKTNRDLVRRIQEIEETKKILKATEKEKELNEMEMEAFKTKVQAFCEDRRKEAFDEAGEPEHCYTLHVKPEFDLTECLEKWHSEFLSDCGNCMGVNSRHAVLFLEDDGSGNAALAAKVINRWDIVYEVSDELKGKRGRVLKNTKQELQAIDEGGPTREFFQHVWKQMAGLKVKSNKSKKEMKLFPLMEQDGYIVAEDESFGIYSCGKFKALKDAQQKARAFYRAIGRMMCHCILASPKDFGPIPIAHNAMPQLYQSVLLRETTPQYARYNLSSLVDHASAVIQTKRKKKDIDVSQEKTSDKKNELLTALFLSNLMDDENPDLALRHNLDEMYVATRKLAMHSLKDGLSAGGFVDWGSIFQSAPSSAVSRIVFAKAQLTESDFFGGPGQWRFIEFQNEERPSSEDEEKWHAYIAAFRNNHEAFKQKFEELCRECFRSDPAFLSDFLWQCTGMRYIPDISIYKDYKVIIEFNVTELTDEHLPEVHTCEQTMKIPINCYNNDFETFKRKLRYAISNSKGLFNQR